jgi:hypothetical protein
MSADVINLPPPPGPAPIPLPEAAAHAIEMLRYSLGQLASRKTIKTEHLDAWLGQVVKELESGLQHETDEATGELSEDLLAALGPGTTGAGIMGARSVLALILAALPDYGPMEAQP